MSTSWHRGTEGGSLFEREWPLAPGLVGIKSEVPVPDGQATRRETPGGGALNGGRGGPSW